MMGEHSRFYRVVEHLEHYIRASVGTHMLIPVARSVEQPGWRLHCHGFFDMAIELRSRGWAVAILESGLVIDTTTNPDA